MSKRYVHHYMTGGQLPVFAGGQHGDGLGALLKSAGRFLLPIITGSTAKFASETAKGLSEGRSFRDSTKSAIGPAIEGALDGAVKKMGRRNMRNKKLKVGSYTRLHNQAGSGRRVYKKKGVSKNIVRKHRILKTNF